MIELPGEHCLLRPLRPEDARALAHHGNDRDVWLNLRDRFPHSYLESHARDYIAHVATQSPTTTFSIVVEGSAIGNIGLHPGTDVERIAAEVGYWIGREWWGRGIAPDALRVATTYAFTELALLRVFALPYLRNASSLRVLEKAGYVREGTMRRSALKDGVVLDQGLYAAYADRWREAGPDRAVA